jgi:hypothetical protein
MRQAVPGFGNRLGENVLGQFFLFWTYPDYCAKKKLHAYHFLWLCSSIKHEAILIVLFARSCAEPINTHTLQLEAHAYNPDILLIYILIFRLDCQMTHPARIFFRTKFSALFPLQSSTNVLTVFARWSNSMDFDPWRA